MRRSDVVRRLLADARMATSDQALFRQFAKLAVAHTHFHFHSEYERLKDRFALFDPDNETRVTVSPEEKEVAADEFAEQLESVLIEANYHEIDHAELERALVEESLIELKTEVDLEDFEEVVMYARGRSTKIIPVRKLRHNGKFNWMKKVDLELEVYERVILMIRFKPREHFEAKKIKDINFQPGKTYLYFYKDIPRNDIELLFPNIEVSMTLKDLALFIVPAAGAFVTTAVRALPQLFLVVGAILVLVGYTEWLHHLDTKEEEVRNIMPVLVSLLSLCMVLGGFAVKQYLKYKGKRLKFLKDVTDTLFFRNLSTNRSVLAMVVDLAEEEHAKEMLLAYFHLLYADGPLTAKELDEAVEAWLRREAGEEVDFDIMDPLGDLAELEVDGQKILFEEDGRYRVAALSDACRVLDAIWDRAYTAPEETLA